MTAEKKSAKSASTVRVKWVVSFIGCTDDMRATIRGLGLRRLWTAMLASKVCEQVGIYLVGERGAHPVRGAGTRFSRSSNRAAAQPKAL